MIAGTYIVSGVLLFVTAWLFDQGVLSAVTMTACWCVVLFFASAGASSAYLTVSEVFPMETRALAIAFFYADRHRRGRHHRAAAVLRPWSARARSPDTALAFCIGASLMIVAGLVEIFLGVKAERQSLEDIAEPLTAADAEGSSPSAPRARAAH